MVDFLLEFWSAIRLDFAATTTAATKVPTETPRRPFMSTEVHHNAQHFFSGVRLCRES